MTCQTENPVTTFQLIALLLAGIWLVLVVVVFRRSTMVLIGGLVVIGVFSLAALVFGWVTAGQLGLGRVDWLRTLGFALAGLAVMLAYSPLADRLATHWFKKPPTLEAFRGIQQSTGKLIAGIAAAWLLGGILEELIARGIILQSLRAVLVAWLPVPLAAGIAILAAALGAGAMHLYQGPRAMLIIAQLSVIYGILFVFSGYNLWAMMLCHGLYDTIAFVRFARGTSRYAKG
jgi:membrane protease YdiL (CAAX protease family)